MSVINLTAAEIGQLLGGEVVGDPSTPVKAVSKIDQGTAGSLSFLANPKYIHFLYETKASVVLVNQDFVPEKPVEATIIKVKDPYMAFCIILDKYFNHARHKSGIEQPSYISENSRIGNDIYLGAFAYIGKNAVIGNNVKIYPGVYIGDNVHIGDGTIIFAGVKIYSECLVGKNCILHSGTVIGSDGFGFAPQADGSYAKIPQTGNVVIEDNVEIGSNCSIDRATLGSTVIKTGVKIDNLIQIAHNAEIGEHTVIAAQSGISGSTKIGKHCVIGGQVGFVGHITVADGSQFGAQSGISKSIEEPNKQWNGSPVVDFRHSLKAAAVIRNLPDLQKKVFELEKKIQEMSHSTGSGQADDSAEDK